MNLETIVPHDNGTDSELAVAKQNLLSRIARLTENDDDPKIPIPGLRAYKRHLPSELTRYTHQPSLCFFVQGSKRILLGADE